MSTPLRNIDQFGDIEFITSRYLDKNVLDVFDTVCDEVATKQAKEMVDFNSSAGGVLSTMATAANPGLDPGHQYLKAVGEWNSKTTEDFIALAFTRLANNKQVAEDIANLAGEWRKAFISEAGEAKYNEVCKTLDCDLANKYVIYRIHKCMYDYLVDKNVPKTSAEYILRRAADGSLIGMPNAMQRSPIEDEINEEAMTKYGATSGEKLAGRAVSFVFDTIGTGGFGSWKGLAKLAGAEVVYAGADAYLENHSKKPNMLTVEDCISQGLLGHDENVFSQIKGKARTTLLDDNSRFTEFNKGLNCGTANANKIAARLRAGDRDIRAAYHSFSHFNGRLHAALRRRRALELLLLYR